MNKTIDLDNLGSDQNDSSDSDIEIKPGKKTNKKVKEPVYNMKKERAPYVFTDARKEAFERARLAREKAREDRKLKKQQEEEMKQKEIEEKIIKKAEVIKKKTAKKTKILDVAPDEIESEEETEIIVKKKKPKKKIVIVESDSDDDIVYTPRNTKKVNTTKSQPQIKQPQPINKKYVPVYY